MQRYRDHRIFTHHEREFVRGREVTIDFEGHRLRAFDQEPVAVALYAWGVRTASRSMKFHRPRGIFCLGGRCMSCVARVDGQPSVRTCRVLCRDGLTVRRENAIPQATDDLLHTLDFVFPKTLPYHHMFTRPLALNKLFQQGVRMFSGLGDLPDQPLPVTPVRERETEVLVVGAGPAGIAAALGAAEGGATVLLIDDAPELGGHLIGWPEPVLGAAHGLAWAGAQQAALTRKGVAVWTGAECLGRYREGFWAVFEGGALTLVRARRVVLATGAYDQPSLFANNDLPNLFSARGLAKLVHRWGICPAVACTVVGTDDAAFSLAEHLPEIGVRVLGLVSPETKVAGDPARAERLQHAGVPLFLGYRVTQAIGNFHLKGLRLEPVGGGEKIDLRCDLVAVSSPGAPSWELAAQAGALVKFAPELGGFAAQADDVGRTGNGEVFIAGEMRGPARPAELHRQGWDAGVAAAFDLHTKPPRPSER